MPQHVPSRRRIPVPSELACAFIVVASGFCCLPVHAQQGWTLGAPNIAVDASLDSFAVGTCLIDESRCFPQKVFCDTAAQDRAEGSVPLPCPGWPLLVQRRIGPGEICIDHRVAAVLPSTDWAARADGSFQEIDLGFRASCRFDRRPADWVASHLEATCLTDETEDGSSTSCGQSDIQGRGAIQIHVPFEACGTTSVSIDFVLGVIDAVVKLREGSPLGDGGPLTKVTIELRDLVHHDSLVHRIERLDVLASVDALSRTFPIPPEVIGAGSYRLSVTLDVDGMVYKDGCDTYAAWASQHAAAEVRLRPFDLDGTGEIDLGDVSMVLLDFGPCPGCATDLDASGEVDVGDVSLLLLAFGPVDCR